MKTNNTDKSLETTKRTRSLVRDQKGGTDFIELLIMVAFITFIVIVGVKAFGTTVSEAFDKQGTNVKGI